MTSSRWCSTPAVRRCAWPKSSSFSRRHSPSWAGWSTTSSRRLRIWLPAACSSSATASGCSRTRRASGQPQAEPGSPGSRIPTATRCPSPRLARLVRVGLTPGAAARARELNQTPGGDGIDHRPELAPALGQVIVQAERMLAVRRAGDHARALETFEALGQNVGRNMLGRCRKLAEARLAGEQVADHEQSPAIAQDVERARDRAARAECRRTELIGGSIGHHSVACILQHTAVDSTDLHSESEYHLTVASAPPAPDRFVAPASPPVAVPQRVLKMLDG